MKKIPLLHAAVLFVIWIIITAGPGFLPGEGNIQLEELISKEFSITIFSAAMVLLVYVFGKKVTELVGFDKIKLKGNRFLIYPIIVILLSLSMSIYKGNFSDVTFLKWIFINTFFVGLSEELMFRGITLSSLAAKFSFLKSAVIVSVLFGAVHVLNGFITGDFSKSLLQAFTATSSGLLFLAVRVKTGSIIPAIILHWIWDFTVFLSINNMLESTAEIRISETFELIISLIMLISPVIFGIIGVFQLSNKNVIKEFMKTQRVINGPYIADT